MSILSSRRTPVLPGVALVGGGVTPSLLMWPTSLKLMPAQVAESRVFGDAACSKLSALERVTPFAQ